MSTTPPRGWRRPKRNSEPATARSSPAGSNPYFQGAKARAEKYARDPARLRELFRTAQEKAKTTDPGPFGQMWTYLKAMMRLIRAFAARAYREVPWQSLVGIVAAMIYFVSPIDLVPDVLPGGYIDDAFVVTLVIRAVKKDLDDFSRGRRSGDADLPCRSHSRRRHDHCDQRAR